MNDTLTDSLAKRHCVETLFAGETQSKPHVTMELLEAIEQTLGSEGESASLERFISAAEMLSFSLHGSPRAGFRYIDFRDEPYDPLWIRDALVRSLRKLTGHRRAVLVIIGLRRSICPKGAAWTFRRRQRYAEAMAYIDELAVRHATPSMHLTLVHLP